MKEALDRGVAAVVTLTTLVTDTSADPPVQQQSKGLITITILDVNEHPPTFTKPRNSEELFINLVSQIDLLIYVCNLNLNRIFLI